MIPHRERGYAVDGLVVHERYQDHAPRAVRTSERGMRTMTGDAGIPCPVCFPAPEAEPPRRWRREPIPEPTADPETAPEVIAEPDVP